MAHDNYSFSFEGLEVFRVAREALALAIEERAAVRGLPGEVGPQLERAMVSVLLNAAPGSPSRGA